MKRWAAPFLLCTVAYSQAKQNDGAPEVVTHEAPATFSSRVNLVSVPVVVRDRSGHPVGNLTQQDFQLFDKGKAQEIVRFSLEGASEKVAATAAGVSGIQTPVAEPSNVAQPSKPVLPERFVAYLFDDVHLKPGDLLNARNAANPHLDKSLDSRTRAAIFTTSGRTTQDFTGDLAKLHAAIDSIKPWTQSNSQDCPVVSYYLADMLINRSHALSPGLSIEQVISMIGSDPALQAVLNDAIACEHLAEPPPGTSPTSAELQQVLPQLRNAAQMSLRFGMDETKAALNVLRDLTRSMSALPGNRTVVMVSPGFLLTEEHRLYENEIFEKAVEAGVTINTLDIRGVATPAGFDAGETPHQTAYYAAQLNRYDNDAAAQAQDLLGEVADGTGGAFFHNSNGLEEGLKQLAARPEYVYVLGFSPDNLKLDGSYHALKVTLKGSTGLTIEARRGYWAPNHAVSAAEQAQEEIEDAVFSRSEMQDIPVKLHTEIFRQSEAKSQLLIESRVDLNSLKFKKADDRNRDTLTIVTGIFDENGRYVKGNQTVLEMQLKDQTLAVVRSSGPMKVSKASFDIPPGRYVVRVVVRDSEGRSMAAQNEGVEIP